ncbi:MAG: Gfo/Idh/MocA family oxidoreductase [Candidatus Schekmanbacteria bacterium]|nr:Gfo/Idh/MocA family oxidoreductase [Candidatus Schekmanbacteria bacterium]
MTLKTQVRLAVVGGGFGARQCWHEHPRCRVTAVADEDAARRAGLQKAYGCSASYHSLEEMLARAQDDFDAVAIFTEAPRHAAHAVRCFAAGKHVVSACPVGITQAECEQVRIAKERSGCRYMMHETSYYRQPTMAARELFAAGELGRIGYCEAEYYHPTIGTFGHPLSYRGTEPTWRLGFPPMLYATHALGFFVGVTGERLTHVTCFGQRVLGDFPEAAQNAYANPFDTQIALGRTAAGTICRFAVSWGLACQGERAQWFGEKLSCFMETAAGAARLRFHAHGEAAPWAVGDDRLQRLPATMRHTSGHDGSYPFLAAELVEALLAGREPAIGLATALAMTLPGIVAHESARQGGALLAVPYGDTASTPDTGVGRMSGDAPLQVSQAPPSLPRPASGGR